MEIYRARSSKPLIIALPILFFIQNECWKFNLFNFELFGRSAPFDEITAGGCLLVWGFALLLHLQNSDCRKRTYSSVVLGFFITISISYLFGSVLTYHQDPWRLWRVMFWFSGLLMYFYLMRTGGYADQALRVFRFFVTYGLAVACFSALVAYIRPLAMLLDKDGVDSRFGMIRVIIFDDGVALAYFYFLSRFMVAKQAKTGLPGSVFNWIGIVFTLFCLIVLGLSRQRIVSVMVITMAAAMLPLFLPGFSKQAGFWVLILVFSLIIVGFGLSNFMDTIMSSLDTSRHAIQNEANLSVLAREKGIKYYFDQFIRTHFVGIGWISAVTSNENNAIVKANLAGMKLVDLGFFEVIFRYGFLGLLVYLRFLWVALRQVKFLNRHGDTATRVLSLTLGMFLISKIITLNTIFFFPGSCLFYAVIMYILDTMFQTLHSDLNSPVAIDDGVSPAEGAVF